MPEPELTLQYPRNKDSNEFRWIFMPYCLKHMGPNQWVVLNRDYKPLGFFTLANLDYKPFTFELHLKPGSVAKLDHRRGEKAKDLQWPHDIFLYDDGCAPTRSTEAMEAYLARVQHLMDMKVSVP